MAPVPDIPAALLIPEILEQILMNVPIIDFISSCRAVCTAWRELICLSSVLQYYHATGIRGLPVDQDETSFNPKDPPKLTPAAEELIRVLWGRLRRLGRCRYEDDSETLLKAENLFTSLTLGLKEVELFIAPPHTYSARVYIEMDHDLSDYGSGPEIRRNIRNKHRNPFIHLVSELCWGFVLCSRNPEPIIGESVVYQIVYRKNPGAFKHWSYVMLNGTKYDRDDVSSERGESSDRGRITVEYNGSIEVASTRWG
ncbi:hypothetical protein TWF281_004815 [Arthrobotrys megalospora]